MWPEWVVTRRGTTDGADAVLAGRGYTLTLSLSYRSHWCLMKRFVRFFTILGLLRGWTSTMMLVVSFLI